MESLFNSYNSDDENDSRGRENSDFQAGRTESSKEVDVNYESVTMDMSEDSSSDQASNQPSPRIEDTARKKYGNGKNSGSSSDHSNSDSDSGSSRNSSPPKRSIADDLKEKKRSDTKDRSPSPRSRSSRDRSRSKLNDRSLRDHKFSDRRSRDDRSSSRRSRDRSPSERRRRERSRSRSRSRDDKSSRRDRSNSDRKDKKSSRDDRDRQDRDRRDRDGDRDRDRDRDRRDKKKHRSRSPVDKDRYRSKYRKSHRSRSRSRSRRSKSRSHSRRRSRSRSRSRSTSGSPRYSSRHYRRSSRDNRRSRERSHNRSGLSYKAEKTKNKMQVLEKLGIELKVPPEVPLILPNHPNSAMMQGLVNPQTLLQKTLKEQVEKVKSATGIELPSYYNPAAVNPSKYAEQIQKRRLLWGNKDKQLNNPGIPQPSLPTAVPTTTSSTINASTGTIWTGAKFGDQDGKMTAKFQRLMGIKQPSTEQPSSSDTAATVADKPDIIKKQEEMFSSMESQYEVARLATHTHRGIGLGFGTFQYPR